MKNPGWFFFTDSVRSACGLGSVATGPFYCPPDRRVYLDLSFFKELAQRFGAPGDFAQAYVIAHEVGHHVQNLLGIAEKITRLQRQASRRKGMRYRSEWNCKQTALPVWGYHAKLGSNLIEPGDFESGLRAASAIGDDQLRRRSREVGATRNMDARLFRTAHRMAAPRSRERRSKCLRYFQGKPPLTREMFRRSHYAVVCKPF